MKKTIKCPNDDHLMEGQILTKQQKVHGVDVCYTTERYVCRDCGAEAADLIQASVIQKAMADEYRKKEGLLTGGEIVEGRKRQGLTHEELARLADVNAADVKRWEKGIIQPRETDDSLRRVLKTEKPVKEQ